MRVLGIDPGYAIVGWGVVEYAGNRFAPIAYGAVCTDKDTPFEQRLIEIYDGIKDICTRYQPEALSIEKLYYQHNQTTVIRDYFFPIRKSFHNSLNCSPK